jgi:hypothetical protein
MDSCIAYAGDSTKIVENTVNAIREQIKSHIKTREQFPPAISEADYQEMVNSNGLFAAYYQIVGDHYVLLKTLSTEDKILLSTAFRKTDALLLKMPQNAFLREPEEKVPSDESSREYLIYLIAHEMNKEIEEAQKRNNKKDLENEVSLDGIYGNPIATIKTPLHLYDLEEKKKKDPSMNWQITTPVLLGVGESLLRLVWK